MGIMANTTDDDPFNDWKVEWRALENIEFVFLFNVVMVIIFVVGLTVNLLTCVVIICDKTMHTATNYYLLNLAIADVLAAFGILVEIRGYNKEDQIMCRIHYFLVATLWRTDVVTVTALAIERYIVIFHPLLLNKRPTGRLVKIFCFIWLIAILETLPETWMIRLLTSSDISVCIFVSSPISRLINGILSLLTFIIPLGIMMFVYTMVAFRVKATQTGYSRDKIFNHRNSSSKVNKLIMAVTVSFVVCWLPFFVLRMIYAVDLRQPWVLKNWDVLTMFTYFSCGFSIVLNPLLFSLMSTKFRRALKKLWNVKTKKRPRRRRTSHQMELR